LGFETVALATATELTERDGVGCIDTEDLEPAPHPTKNKTANSVSHFMVVFLLGIENRVPWHFCQEYLLNLIVVVGIQTNVTAVTVGVFLAHVHVDGAFWNLWCRTDKQPASIY
jgi:hypothetical protein